MPQHQGTAEDADRVQGELGCGVHLVVIVDDENVPAVDAAAEAPCSSSSRG